MGIAEDYNWGHAESADTKGQKHLLERKEGEEKLEIKVHWTRGRAGGSGDFSLAGLQWFSLAGFWSFSLAGLRYFLLAGLLLGKEKLPSPSRVVRGASSCVGKASSCWSLQTVAGGSGESFPFWAF